MMIDVHIIIIKPQIILQFPNFSIEKTLSPLTSYQRKMTLVVSLLELQIFLVQQSF